ncbi:hypothetical protein BP6252_03136 [Coleophoma cylindrospora]|uniref:Uncharacterized protein n=1 Tax=Coleophoma cylindrospora TaxID=1849047 RepID=A0A3D8S7J3_9HELO|nr:hypothetical protein BP6252_03136 [Coleophoma cylindrospora]
MPPAKEDDPASPMQIRPGAGTYKRSCGPRRRGGMKNSSSKHHRTEAGSPSKAVSFSAEDDAASEIQSRKTEKVTQKHDSDDSPEEEEFVFSHPRAPTPYSSKRANAHESDTSMSTGDSADIKSITTHTDEGVFFMDIDDQLPVTQKPESEENNGKGKGKGKEIAAFTTENCIGKRTRARTMESPSKVKTPVKPRDRRLDDSPNHPVLRPTEPVTSSPPDLDISEGKVSSSADTSTVEALAITTAELKGLTTLAQKHLRRSAKFRQANDNDEAILVNNRRFESHSYEVIAQCMRANHKRRTQENDVVMTPAPEFQVPSSGSRSVSPKRKADDAFDNALPIRSRPISQSEFKRDDFDMNAFDDEGDRSPKRKAIEIPTGQKAVHMPQSLKISTKIVGDKIDLPGRNKSGTNSTAHSQSNRWARAMSPEKSAVPAKYIIESEKEREMLARYRQTTQDRLSNLLLKIKEVEGEKTDALQSISDNLSHYITALHDEMVQEISVRVMEKINGGLCNKDCACHVTPSMEGLDGLERLAISSKLRLDQIRVPQIPSELVQVLEEYPLNSSADWYEAGYTRLDAMRAQDTKVESLAPTASLDKEENAFNPLQDMASEEQC